MRYDPDKHHPPKDGAWRTGRRSIRLKDYDYSQPGGYYITVCVHHRECLFGDIVDAEMKMNRFGETVKECWEEIPRKYHNVEMDEFVVMPNHFHGIIIINDSEPNDNNVGAIFVGAIHELPLQNELAQRMDIKRRRRMLVPKIIGRFKMNSAKRINEIRNSAGASLWQRGYYEHIIRNNEELNRIRKYIINNPVRWSQDKENVGDFH
jgi:putative transposase